MPRISLKAARINAGLTQSQVASAARVSTTTVANWERGTVEPSWTDFVFLCNLYGFKEDDIFLPKHTPKRCGKVSEDVTA